MSKGNVYANTRSVVHKGDSLTNVGAVPDVCKTPTPGGPIPIPYINVAFNRNLTKGTKKVRIAGNSIAISKSKLSTSTGDEPGTLGGIVSGKFKGKMAWGTSSMNVKAEGKGVVRFMDITMHNGNTYNTAWTEIGNIAVTFDAYGDDTKCSVCKKSPDTHRAHETQEAAGLCQQLVSRLTTRVEEVDRKIRDLAKESEDMTKKIHELEQADELGRDKDAIKRIDDQLNNLMGGKTKGEFFQSASAEDKATAGKLNKERKQAEGEKKNEKEIKKLQKKRSENNKKVGELAKKKAFKDWGKGYMVGVLICKCCNTKYASASGELPPGFSEDANALGLTPVGPEALGSKESQKTYADITSPRLRNGTDKEKAQARKRMDKNYTKWKKNPKKNSPERGACAAPKLVQACQKAGHSVGSISEKWFAPINQDETTVTQNRKEHRKWGPIKYKKTEKVTFKHGETVTSCDTCKRELPPMLCDNEKDKCS